MQARAGTCPYLLIHQSCATRGLCPVTAVTTSTALAPGAQEGSASNRGGSGGAWWAGKDFGSFSPCDEGPWRILSQREAI